MTPPTDQDGTSPVAALIDRLRQRLGRPDAEIVETHVSVLAFGDDEVLKAKKAERFEFLDLRDVTDRRRLCHDEVELNRRLAPDVYLGVVELPPTDDAPSEPAVWLRRLDAGSRLSERIEKGEEVRGCLAGVARAVAGLHARSTLDPPGSVGTVEQIGALWDDGIDQISRFVGEVIPRDEHRLVRHLARRYLRGRRPLFEARRAQGRIVDGHGDLRAEDIFCLHGGPSIIDCLEFSERFRHGDALLDLAFLAMDLELVGRRDLADSLTEHYSELSGDRWPSSLERFYLAYRAHVRAKVACLRLEQGDGSARSEAGSLHRLAHSALEDARVRLVIIGGLPGVGKSTVAGELGRRRGWPVLDSDVVRKRLHGRDPLAPTTPAERGALYSEEANEATYVALLRQARLLLTNGWSAVVEASWSDRSQRLQAEAAAGASGADLVEVRCVAPTGLAEQRLRERQAGPSDADVEVHGTMAAAFDPWPRAEPLPTSGTISDTVDQVEQLVTRPVFTR